MNLFSFAFEATGTRWVVDIDQKLSDKERKTIENLVKNRVENFEKTYSRFREGSLVDRVAKGEAEILLPEDAKPLFNIYFKLYELTGGLFSPLMGQTLEDAGYDKNYSLVSKGFSRRRALGETLEYDFPKLTVKSPVKMDFGACGKGYIVDIVGAQLKGLGVKNYFVDAGGDILYLSEKSDEMRIGLESPKNKDEVIGVCNLVSGSICGSSTNRRRWRNFSHIINPESFASPTAILSTWVVARSAVEADALATCLFFVEPEILGEFDFEYVILYEDFSIKKSDNFTGEFFNG